MEINVRRRLSISLGGPNWNDNGTNDDRRLETGTHTTNDIQRWCGLEAIRKRNMDGKKEIQNYESFT